MKCYYGGFGNWIGGVSAGGVFPGSVSSLPLALESSSMSPHSIFPHLCVHPSDLSVDMTFLGGMLGSAPACTGGTVFGLVAVYSFSGGGCSVLRGILLWGCIVFITRAVSGVLNCRCWSVLGVTVDFDPSPACALLIECVSVSPLFAVPLLTMPFPYIFSPPHPCTPSSYTHFLSSSSSCSSSFRALRALSRSYFPNCLLPFWFEIPTRMTCF